ncbi:L-serine ammonia-lyase, iron-sulfur-dependent, subunit alpha [Tepidanaerobacter syntrophicus]|uniref:L-serine ammonia-lyase, iron-sulfur-dependent, subunit alpha n=1 Tax=Tepidanaerobacter syntrophicus TaxID=224999 RepID=UPI001BD454AB|nr:L-serine ammonia-lyase, iron-sulfur-dependent, subunit alpha [Tepidanaerobacter syntrophicus]
MATLEFKKLIEQKMPLTLGELIEIAEKTKLSPAAIAIEEAQIQTGKNKREVLNLVLKQFEHNLKAVDIGMTTGKSLLFGRVGAELASIDGPKIVEDKFIDKTLMYTLAAQVGNHTIGLRPCAGTGDSCPYTGFIKTLMDDDYDQEYIGEVASLILKVGSVFRVGKTSTGCNMEGFGAGACAMAAAFTELKGGNPKTMERAMVLSLSPTIGVPCTPRVMVPGLCATHIGGAVLIGAMAANLAINTDIEVNVPIDVMVSMAAEVHPISAKEIVPTVIKFMEPFFKKNPLVEKLVDDTVKLKEEARIKETIKESQEISKRLAAGAKPITETLGEAVVGGSSQAVGSPTNAARIAHFLCKGKIKKVKIELYPELFARRGINIPGILMAALFGTSTADYEMYGKIMDKIKETGIEVEILETQEYQVQRITIVAEETTSMVDTLNRGGGRLVLRDASPSKNEALKIAKELGIIVANS